jgi:cell division protein FtsI/penicillin-binding protein 2
VYIRKRSLRFSLIFLFIICCLIFFSIKLIIIQFFRSSYLIEIADKQHNHLITLEPVRGTIYDRQMRPIALNVPVYSVYANPRQMTKADKELAIEKLSSLLRIDRAALQERLDRRKYFVWLERKIPVAIAQEIKKQRIPGIGFIKESKRHYPNQSLAAHLIGFAGIDNVGLEGLELAFDHYLKGDFGWQRIIRDARQQDLLLEKEFYPPRDGFHLVLSIDETIQYIAETALEKAMEKHKALGATIIVMNPRTGEILALANRPTFDLNNYMASPIGNRTNRAVAYVFEPGSVFKIVAATAALEEKIFKETDKIFCENGEYRVANHVLHDYHPYGTLSFQEVIQNSSNIGTTKVAQKMGPQLLYQYAQRFGFGSKTNIEIRGEVPGVLKNPREWSKTSISAIPIGQEVTVTPLQLVCAISAIANDGILMKPFVVKDIRDNRDEVISAFAPQQRARVMSEETAKRIKVILTAAVEQGTGKMARIEGVKVAGKTGTAQKVFNGVYSQNRFFATFIGFAPVDNPQVAVVVTFDDPHPNHFGGTVAAPVFKEVVENTLKYFNAQENIYAK